MDGVFGLSGLSGVSGFSGFSLKNWLLAKGYFVKESKAPEGYQMDENAYYFEITEDGQVAVVENSEAGCGFSDCPGCPAFPVSPVFH